jgi:lipid A ethanolaminephosphotransferase
MLVAMSSTKTARQRVTLSFFKRSAAPAILLTSAWLVAVDNGGYWNLISGLPIESGSAGAWFFASVVVFSVVLVNLALTLLAWGRAARYVLSAVLIVSAAAGHFMSQYGILLDDEMIRNIFETDRAEALNCWGRGLLFRYGDAARRAARVADLAAGAGATEDLPHPARKISVAGLTLAILAVAVVPFFKEYASMVRNHREIRYLLTPVNYLHSLYVCG